LFIKTARKKSGRHGEIIVVQEGIKAHSALDMKAYPVHPVLHRRTGTNNIPCIGRR
jgi:hypothetical protein